MNVRLAVAILIALAGCTRPEPLAARGTREGVLHIGNDAEPQDLDPQIVTGLAEQRVIQALFEGLCQLEPEQLRPVPAAAESWDISPDGTVYTFHLREAARWSNGDPVTAQDFVYAWRRILTPELASPYAYLLHVIVNARAFNEGRLADFSQVGVRALDDHTLEVRLNNPTPYFLAMQIHPAWQPVHRATIERFGGMARRGTPWTRAGNLVGNGPFRLVEWSPNRVIRVERNPHYWDRDAVRLNAVCFYPTENAQTGERNFRAGQRHMVTEVPLNKVELYRRESPELIKIHPVFGTYFYRFNVTRPPLDDVRVRRALALAVDREAICRNVLQSGQAPAWSFTPPGAAGYACAARLGFDLDEARRLLAEAGYPEGRGFPALELLYSTRERNKLLAEALQHMWKENLNVAVALVNQEWKVYLASMADLDYTVAASSWYGDFFDPVSFLECFLSDSGNNRTGWASPRYDALLAEAAATPDAGRRLALFQEAEKELLDAAPILPLHYYMREVLLSPDVKGWRPNLLAHVPYKYLHLEAAPHDAT